MTADIIQARYDELDTLATRFGQQAELTANLDAQVRRCLQALEHGGWEGKGSAAFVAEMYGTLLPANDRLRQALDDARAVTLEAKQIYQQAEQEAAAIFGKGTAGGDDLGKSFEEKPIPTPVPTPNPQPGGSVAFSPEGFVNWLNELLRPIDLVDKLGAEKQFRGVMEEVGRLLNHENHTIGYIKAAGQITDFLFGATKVMGGIGNLLTLNDYQRYFNGELTNQEVARTLITTWFPPTLINISVRVAMGPTGRIMEGLGYKLDVGDQIVDWLVSNVPDPNGHAHGLATPVE